MLNVKTLTNTLSRMELPELHDYATLHKNDPYIVTLALSIANQKKQMKAGQAGQAGMQPQPKVVDQELSQMMAPLPQQQSLPEDQGIGQLPAPNMQNMAEGGIVAFDDGGEVPSFAGPAGSYVDPLAAYLKQLGITPQEFLAKTGPEQQQIRAQAPVAIPKTPPPAVVTEKPGIKTLLGKSMTKGLPAAQVAAGLLSTSDEELKTLKQADEARIARWQSIVNESPEDYASRKVAEFEAQAGKKLSPDARLAYMSQFVQDKIAGQVKRGEAGYTTESQRPAPTTTYTGKKPLPGKTPPGQPPVAPGAAASSADADYMAGIDKLLKGSQTGGAKTTLDAKRYDVTAPQLASATPKDMADRLAAGMGPNPTVSPLAGQQTELNKAKVASRQKYADDLANQFKEQGLAFTDTLNKLTSKEKRVQTMEDNQLGMSMFEAGLAMMAGESPYAMVNIGKGAQVGTKKYMEIQDKVEGARDKIDDAKMKIEEFRRNEANMNAREQRLARKDVDDAVSDGAQASLNLMRENFNLKHAEGLAFVNNSYMLEKFNAEQTTSANIHNQSTRAALDTAAANRASQEGISARSNATQLGLAALEAKYRASNPAAGSLGFFKALAPDGDPVKGMKIYSENLGPESKGINAFALEAIKDPSLLPRLEAGSAQDRQLAASIKQHMQGMMVSPVNLPSGAANVRP